MNGSEYVTQELMNGNIPNMMIRMALAQMEDNEDKMLEIFTGLVAKAFEDGKADAKMTE